jgi:molybdate transport system substrate-binding protein
MMRAVLALTSISRRFMHLAPTAVAALLLAAGCGTSSPTTSSSSSATSTGAAAKATTATQSGATASGPTVLAAASLTKVFPRIEPRGRYTFGGSGALATEIEQGAPADVFAAASPKQPAELLAKKLIDRPIQFATNTLVLIVPRDNPAEITSVADIAKPGVKLVICNATVPCGDYARNVFMNLGITPTAMRNVVSQTTDVTQTVAEVALGQADAGFVYITDAKAANGKVKVIRLPTKAKPQAADVIAVVKSGRNQTAAKAFIAKVMSPAGQARLRAAGFGKP